MNVFMPLPDSGMMRPNLAPQLSAEASWNSVPEVRLFASKINIYAFQKVYKANSCISPSESIKSYAQKLISQKKWIILGYTVASIPNSYKKKTKINFTVEFQGTSSSPSGPKYFARFYSNIFLWIFLWSFSRLLSYEEQLLPNFFRQPNISIQVPFEKFLFIFTGFGCSPFHLLAFFEFVFVLLTVL